MKPYGGKTPSSCYACCKAHGGPAHMANKRRERFRAANDIALAIDGISVHYDDDPPCCDYDCEVCYGIDAIDARDGFPLPPLTAPLVALALEAA